MSLSINNQQYDNFHFIGIFGIGMSAIAQYLAPTCTITGSDRSLGADETIDMQKGLLACGCSLYNQNGSGVSKKTSAIVISSAIEETNPDIVAAKKLGIPTLHRSEVLAAIVAQSDTISVTGTSGKSTVSALIFHLLQQCDLNPSYISGAKLHALQEQGLIGNAFKGDGPLVIEADESDGTVINYYPTLSVLLNISKDHKEISEVQALLQQAAQQSQTVLYNGDDQYLATIEGASFGLSEKCTIAPSDYGTDATKSWFCIDSTTFTIPQPGMHTVLNGLAAYGAAKQYHCSDEQLVTAFASYKGIERRFDHYPTARGIEVIDDYAHNPEKIAAALTAAQLISDKVTVLFQPHGFGPLAFMLEDLATMFKATLRPKDTLLLLPVFYAGGTVDKTINSDTLEEAIGLENAITLNKEEYLTACDQTRSDSVILLLGARDPGLPAYAQEIADEIAGLLEDIEE